MELTFTEAVCFTCTAIYVIGLVWTLIITLDDLTPDREHWWLDIVMCFLWPALLLMMFVAVLSDTEK